VTLRQPWELAGTAGRDSRGWGKRERWKSTNLQHSWVDDGEVVGSGRKKEVGDGWEE